MSSRRGNSRENKVRDLMADMGWFAMCGRASAGPADVLAVKAGEKPRLIQVKSDAKGPYDNFRPAERLELVEAMIAAGGIAVLAWWPPGGRRPEYPKWIPWHDWPSPPDVPGGVHVLGRMT